VGCFIGGGVCLQQGSGRVELGCEMGGTEGEICPGRGKEVKLQYLG